MKLPRVIYHKRKARKYDKGSISLLCNNCTGGVILHDMGLRFDTPTINVDIRNAEEYLYFVENIEHFIDSEVHEIELEKYDLPAGYLIYNNKKVDIVFTHYKNFEAGKRKWQERMKRLDLSNIYVIYEGPKVSEDFMERFSKLPYKKAVISSKRDNLKWNFYHGFDFYREWKPGKILEYKSWFSVKRFLDDFDYIKFLNKTDRPSAFFENVVI